MASHLTVCICHGAKKHMLLVTENTTVEELALMVWIEVFNEQPPEDTSSLCSLVCFIFRGRKLSSPDLTLGALHVKNGERIMVLPKKHLYPSTRSTVASKGCNSKSNDRQPASAVREDNIHPAYRDLDKLGAEISSCEGVVQQLSKEVRASLAAASGQQPELQQHVKTIAGRHEEHMKLLLRLDAVQTDGDSSIRSQRKALVVRVQSGLNALDVLKSAVNHALKGDYTKGQSLLDKQQ